MKIIVTHVTDANRRKRGTAAITLTQASNQPISVGYQERHYVATGKTTNSPTGERVFEMMARDYFIERLWITLDGKQLWELQPLAL
ncbi:MAG: hypothetical protein M1572_08085 [Gammaproteobacteria bacterium]|nr:hypothetical protein [Gammaproteobacteria bacterium]MCL5796519.1 hypothetical protein [Gammaproteobacteria bacterium]HQT03388.1 hypothetical protein [Thiotrichales bacterium]